MTAAAEAASAHIVAVDPAFQPVIQAAGPFDLPSPDSDAFNSLARAIVFQQLAGHAARAIHGRFSARFGGHPTAAAIVEATPEDLKAVGLSTAKAASIMDLAARTIDGTVALDRLDELSDDEIVRRLTTVRGIGRWTGQMFLLFQLRRPDVWPVDDFGVRKGFAQIHVQATPPTPRALDLLGEIYRPYRSAAAWYCWRAVDTVLPSA